MRLTTHLRYPFLPILLLLPALAFGLPTELRGSLDSLSRLQPGQAQRISIKTPEGLYEIQLSRVIARRPALYRRGNESLDVSQWRSPLLFRGNVRRKQGQSLRGRLHGVAADIYKGTLRVRFYGARVLRIYTASFPMQTGTRIRGDISHLPSNFPLHCAFESRSQAAVVGNLALVRTARPRRELEFAADADAEYVAAAGSSQEAAAEILQSMNVVNGIYGDQLGVEVTLTEQNEFSDSGAQPFQSEDAEDLRDQLAAYRNTTPYAAPFDAAQLFTGKDILLADPDIGTGIVGISYLSIYDDFSDPGTICRYDNDYSYTVVERYIPAHRAFSATYQGILTAHELGHNLSLFHINSGVMYFAPSESTNTMAIDSIDTALRYLNAHGDCLSRLGPGVNVSSLRLRSGAFDARYLPSDYSGQSCKLKLYGSRKQKYVLSDSRRHSDAKLLRTLDVVSGESLRLRGKIRTFLKPGAPKYYLVAELFCDGQVAALSEVRAVSSSHEKFLDKLKASLKKR